ncbi:MAG: hypothetical protein U9R26_02215 [Campylobacterota bacterium]|nr:hypothetical protein [Campylobacterota bacterium]
MASKIKQEGGGILGLSIRVIALTAIVIMLFGIYVGVLIYGENSLTVLNHLSHEKENLMREATQLKNENQRLQKEFFELKQLQPGEE